VCVCVCVSGCGWVCGYELVWVGVGVCVCVGVPTQDKLRNLTDETSLQLSRQAVIAAARLSFVWGAFITRSTCPRSPGVLTRCSMAPSELIRLSFASCE
jgi:hypothetical protein